MKALIGCSPETPLPYITILAIIAADIPVGIYKNNFLHRIHSNKNIHIHVLHTRQTLLTKDVLNVYQYLFSIMYLLYKHATIV